MSATAIAQAFDAAGYKDPLDKLAAEAWAKWSTAAAKGARRDYVRTQTTPAMKFALLERYRPQVLAQALAEAVAVLQAEAGIPFGDYRTVSGLWKRMGLAVIDGRRQRRVKDKEAAAVHAYSLRRRAEVFAFVSDSMFRHQWAADKDEDGKNPTKSGKPVSVPAHPTGPYGEVYARRRAHTEPRIEATDDLAENDPAKWTKGRCHNDARRVMSKALLRDLWRVSRGLPPRGFSGEVA